MHVNFTTHTKAYEPTSYSSFSNSKRCIAEYVDLYFRAETEIRFCERGF